MSSRDEEQRPYLNERRCESLFKPVVDAADVVRCTLWGGHTPRALHRGWDANGLHQHWEDEEAWKLPKSPEDRRIGQLQQVVDALLAGEPVVANTRFVGGDLYTDRANQTFHFYNAAFNSTRFIAAPVEGQPAIIMHWAVNIVGGLEGRTYIAQQLSEDLAQRVSKDFGGGDGDS